MLRGPGENLGLKAETEVKATVLLRGRGQYVEAKVEANVTRTRPKRWPHGQCALEILTSLGDNVQSMCIY